MFALRKPEHQGVYSKAEHPEIFAQSDPPLLIWASETFHRKLRPNGTDSATVTMDIGNHHRCFEWCHRWPPTTSPSIHMPQDARMAISPQRVFRYTSCLLLG